jgi:anti-sigma regulatory factor (Ser/Thr protein kinase)
MPEPSSFWQRHRVQSFREVRDELWQFFEQLGIPTRISKDLISATQEACNNACQHGIDGVGCDIAVAYIEGTVTIEVADRGRGFDFDSVKSRWPPALLNTSGRGLFLISELSDQTEVVQRRPGTLVRIFKAVP